MEILSSSDRDIEKAAAALAAGALVAFPTETVYGLGGDAFNPPVLARIFEAKNRPFFDPLIIHIADLFALSRLVDDALLSAKAKERLSVLSARLWPGPLTLVLPKRREVPDLATAGLPTAAIRFPSHETAQKLIRLSTGAVAAPSANPFGYLSPTRAEHVISQLSAKADFIIDGGRTELGVESTVLDICGDTPRILRPGGVSREAIETLIGKTEPGKAEIGKAEIGSDDGGAGAQLSPGRLKSHYAPLTPIVLHGRGELAFLPDMPGEGRLYFSSPVGAKGAANGGPRNFPPERTRTLSESGELTEAAANLFDMLHELDEMGLSLIRAEEVPGRGLGEAINDRLRRARQKP